MDRLVVCLVAQLLGSSWVPEEHVMSVGIVVVVSRVWALGHPEVVETVVCRMVWKSGGVWIGLVLWDRHVKKGDIVGSRVWA